MQSRTLGPWTPAIAAGAVLVVVVGASAFGGSKSPSITAISAGSTTTPSVVAASVVAPTAAITAPLVTSPPIDYTALTRTITDGMTGDDVRRVQQRLKDLGFDPGPADGVFGLQTIQSVWAYKKLVDGVDSSKVEGSVTPELWDAMQQPMFVRPRRPELTSTHIEIYLDSQVMVLFKNDVPDLITHVSSGSGEDWCEEVTIDPGEQGNENGTEPLKKGICGKSITPGGQFSITRKLKAVDDPDGDGWREGQLGRMFQPVYWNYGLAIHGSSRVPKEPASHGCIRIPMHIAEYFPDLVSKGDDVYVWDGVSEPETYGRQKPYFDRADPDYSTTTTVATTTTKAGATTTTKPQSASSSSSTTSSTTTTSSSTTSTSTSTTSTTVAATNPPATAVP